MINSIKGKVEPMVGDITTNEFSKRITEILDFDAVSVDLRDVNTNELLCTDLRFLILLNRPSDPTLTHPEYKE